MNLADAAQLILTLQLKDEMSAGLKGIQGALDKTNTKGATLQGGLSKIGAGIGVGIRNTAKIGAVGLGLLWTQVDAGIDSLVELEDVTNQTEAVIKSTGGAAGLTAEDIRDLANEMEELSGVDDKVIQSGENVLLTFKNIGQEVFPQATLAALDMSEAMDTDLQSSIVLIGKALNDPEKGLSALTRVGVTFDEETKKIIADMVAMGDTAGAQQLIIQELNSEFGGSAQASMEGYRGTQLRLKDTWEELQQTLAQALLPALDNLSRTLREKLMDPEVKEGVKKLGEGIAGLFSKENVKDGGEALKGLFTFLKELPWSNIKDGLSFAAENAKKVVDVFRSLPPGVQAGLLTFLAANKLSGGLITAGLGELVKVALSSLRTITAANVTVIGANVTGGGGGVPIVGGAGAAGAAAGAGLGIGAIAAGVAAGAGAAVLAIDGVAAVDRQILAMNGLNTRQIELQNQITQWTADRAYAQKRGADATYLATFTTKIDAARAEMSAITTNTQIMNHVASEIRERIGTTNANLDRDYGLGVDRRSILREIHADALRQEHLAQVGNERAAEAKDRLSAIQTYSQRMAQKDLSVNVTVHTALNVSGRSIAETVARIERLQGDRYNY